MAKTKSGDRSSYRAVMMKLSSGQIQRRASETPPWGKGLARGGQSVRASGGWRMPKPVGAEETEQDIAGGW